MTSPRILIFANGLLPDIARARALVQPDDVIVAADGGTHYALELGLIPAVVIGDLDSLDETDRARIFKESVTLRQYSADKDETDLELALQYALQQEPAAVRIVAGLGNRLDHTLATISMLADANLSAVECRLDDGIEEAWFCRGHSEVRGQRGDLVSLVPWGQAVAGVRTEGLRWALRGESLYPQKTRGVSNELLGDLARVHIEAGLLLIIHRRL